MPKLTAADKRLVQAYLHKYVQVGQPITVRQYEHVLKWIGGLTYEEIAQAEGKSKATIGYAVKREVSKILVFAKNYEKR